MEPRALLTVLVRALGMYFLVSSAIGIVTLALITDPIWEQLIAPAVGLLAGVLLFAKGDVIADLPYRDGGTPQG